MTLNKIFIHKKDLSYSEIKESDSDITFIRKDALLEWAKMEQMKSNTILADDWWQSVIDKIKSL